MIALHGTAAHVETVVRHFRRAQESIALDREARQLATRGLHYHYDDDGSLVLQARLPAEAGALLVRALDRATAGWHRDRRDRDVSAETSADGSAAHGSAAQSGSTPAPTLAAETARRLACDASIVRIVEDGQGRPLDVGRKTRSIPPSIRRALQSRDAGCRFPGCTHTRFLDGHHIRHWADGGATRLSNLVLLCRHHHRQVHEGRVEVQVLDDGALRFKGPDGRAFEAAPGTRGDSRQIVLTHRREGLAIDAGTAVTRWAGERMDYAMAVEGLLMQQERGETGSSGLGVSAETLRLKANPY
ncbi:MAG: DUF222 domain-containing protein [Pseudomonadota bacterium]|nr:DUF222 domain-containing protein [Pseudomonadota bacterium]